MELHTTYSKLVAEAEAEEIAKRRFRICVWLCIIVFLAVNLIPLIVVASKNSLNDTDVPFVGTSCENTTVPCGYGVCDNGVCVCHPEYAVYNPSIERGYCSYRRVKQCSIFALDAAFFTGFMGLGRITMVDFAIGFSQFGLWLMCWLPYFLLQCASEQARNVYRYVQMMLLCGVIAWWSYDIYVLSDGNKEIPDGNGVSLYPCDI